MWLTRHSSESYTPLYLLASLGAGGMAVAVYLHLMVLTPHPVTPVPTLDSLSVFWRDAGFWERIGVGTAWSVTLVLALIHVVLLLWNVRAYKQFKATADFETLVRSNATFQRMAWPLTLAMALNAGFVAALLTIPGLWSIIEFIYPWAIAAFLAIGIAALKMQASILGEQLTQGGFACEKNNNLGMMMSPFALAMIAVGFSGPAAMSGATPTILVAAALCIAFFVMAVLSSLVFFLTAMRVIFAQGVNQDSSQTLMVGVPIATVLGIAGYRLAMMLGQHFGVAIPPILLFLGFVAIMAVQLMFILFGASILLRNEMLRKALSDGPTPLSFALVCPGVGFIVTFQFFIHRGLLAVLPQSGVVVPAITVIVVLAQIALLAAYANMVKRQ